MERKSALGGIVLEIPYKGYLVTITSSREMVELRGVQVPRWITEHRRAARGPDRFVKVEVRDGAPELVELSFRSNRPGQGEVRDKHVRAEQVSRLAEDLYASCFMDIGTSKDDPERAITAARKIVERQRLPREYRDLNDDMLREVAEVYRAHVEGAPTRAVAKHFGVGARMASTYVGKAREKKFLRPTRQGQKKA
ncbi:hypothetical protein [Mycobacterium sp.]|uniref:hypothetical protein n=1 Tax=Mycobacterium sp. TaxID=1785 RepID=UPI000CB106EB|nr:hypothetical protein [Mycobacterium sp.]PJE01903.1 MAG: hypothetical protein CK428_30610 [Mycobacterium sp.]